MATYTNSEKENIITLICDKVIEDKISFNEAVKDSDISLVSFYKWISKEEGLQTLYNYARIVRSDILFEEIIEIADNTEEGTVIETDDHGRTKEKKGDMTQHRRLKIDSRKWVAAKMQPKKYGDRLNLESPEGTMTPHTIITTLTQKQLNEKIKK